MMGGGGKIRIIKVDYTGSANTMVVLLLVLLLGRSYTDCAHSKMDANFDNLSHRGYGIIIDPQHYSLNPKSYLNLKRCSTSEPGSREGSRHP